MGAKQSSQTRAKELPRSTLDIFQKRRFQYSLEDLLLAFFPYLMGMTLMAMIGWVVLQYCGLLKPPSPIIVYQIPQAETPPIDTSAIWKSPLILAGTMALSVSSVVYLKFS